MWLYIISVFVIGGFLLNRLNVSITSITGSANYSYFPSVYEISITMMIVAVGMWVFGLIVRNFPVFQEDEIEEGKLRFETGEIILSE